MLGKLLKYELKSTARIFLPLYLALIVMSFLVGTFAMTTQSMGLIGGILTFVYVALMIAVVVVTIVVVIQRFYKNLLCDEGYLMFTLPVKSSQHGLSKMFAGLLWQSLSVIVGSFSIFCIMFVVSSSRSITASIGEMFRLFNVAYVYWQQTYELNLGVIVLLTIIVLLCSAAANTQMIYAALSVGHISGKRPVLMSVVCYIGFLIVLQIIGSLVSNILELVGVFDSSYWNDFFQSPSSVYAFMWIGIATCALMFIAFFLVTTITLKKKLNLA